jgi:hypothetical protein
MADSTVSGIGEVSLPSGTGVSRVSAVGWHQCTSSGGYFLAAEGQNSCSVYASAATGQDRLDNTGQSASQYNCLAAAQALIAQSGMAAQGRTTLQVVHDEDIPSGCTIQTGGITGGDASHAGDNAAYYNTHPNGHSISGRYTLVCTQGVSGACDVSGAFRDMNLEAGGYAICFCDGDHGNGACDHGNEFIKISGSGLTADKAGQTYNGAPASTDMVPTEPALKIITSPRLGRTANLANSHMTNIRTVEGVDQVYGIKGDAVSGYEVQDDDKIYFASDCTTIHGVDAADKTAPIDVTDFDYGYSGDSSSSTFMSGRFQIPAALTSDGGNTRTISSCYATYESLLPIASLNSVQEAKLSYAQLQDGLEIIAKPRIGTITLPLAQLPGGSDPVTTPELFHVRAVTDSTPTFSVTTLKHGDKLYFKPHTTTSYGGLVDCTAGTQDPDGTIIPGIPAANGDDSTTLLAGHSFSGSSGKVTLPADTTLKGTDLGFGALAPLVLSACFIPAGALENVHVGTRTKAWGADDTQGTSDDIATGCLNQRLGAYPKGCSCPVDTPKVAVGGGTNSNGGLCSRTSMTITTSSGTTTTLRPELINPVLLLDQLTIFAEPTDALVNSWFIGHVYELKFTQPQFGTYGTKSFATGTAGDVVVLQKTTHDRNTAYCSDVNTISPSDYTIGSATSAKMTLGDYSDTLNHYGTTATRGEQTLPDGAVVRATDGTTLAQPPSDIHGGNFERGGAAMISALAYGKVNELPVGMYKICYATKESEGDDATDYKMLQMEFEILPATATTPTMSTPRSLLLGTDMVVSWESTVNLQTRLQTDNSWIGLYREGTCMGAHGKIGDEWNTQQNQVYHTQDENSAGYAAVTPPGKYAESNQHECYLAYQFIESGVQSGVVRFSVADYGVGGKYNVRFFQGDSRNVQGQTCRGLAGTASETYIDCVLEAAVVSDTIEIFADSKNLDHMDNIPGMEVVFNDQRARFQKGSRANKMK